MVQAVEVDPGKIEAPRNEVPTESGGRELVAA